MNSILLVEDDSVIIKSLTEFLSDEGFSVSHADGQSKAISMMNDLSFDILLVDISLKEGNGFAVCACAKEKGLPVIFLIRRHFFYPAVPDKVHSYLLYQCS